MRLWIIATRELELENLAHREYIFYYVAGGRWRKQFHAVC